MIKSRVALSVVVLAFSASGLFALAGCPRQSEGERCDLANGESGEDSDCDDGLVCTDSQKLGTSSDICCPEDLNTATHPACIPDTGSAGGGGSTSSSGTGGTGGAGGSTSSSGTGGTGGTGGSGGSGGAGGSGGSGGAAGGSGGGGSGGN